MYSQSRKMRGVKPNRHGGGKPEGKEGVSTSHVRGQDFIPKGRRGYLTPLSEDVGLFYTLRVRRTLRACASEHDVSLSETELRAAKPNFHRGRLAPALESRGKSGSPPKKVSVG